MISCPGASKLAFSCMMSSQTSPRHHDGLDTLRGRSDTQSATIVKDS